MCCALVCRSGWGPQARASVNRPGKYPRGVAAKALLRLQMLRLLGQLRPAAAHAGALLLRHACLTPPQALGGNSTSSGSGVSGSSSSSGPLARGELLLSTLIAIGKYAAVCTSRLAASLASALQTMAQRSSQHQCPGCHRDSSVVRRFQA